MIESIQDALKAIQEKGAQPPITRYRYTNGDYSAEKAMELVKAIGESHCPGFAIDDDNRFAYENFVKWLHGDQTMRAIDPDTKDEVPGDMKKGIYIAGGIGTGKTMCTEVMAEYGQMFVFKITFGGNRDRALTWASDSADEIVQGFVKDKETDWWKAKDTVCIQDLGSEPTEAVAMGFRVNVLRSLLEYRGDHRDRLTIITSNYPMASPVLAEAYGERVTSRLRGMCNYYEMKGKDRRR